MIQFTSNSSLLRLFVHFACLSHIFSLLQRIYFLTRHFNCHFCLFLIKFHCFAACPCQSTVLRVHCQVQVKPPASVRWFEATADVVLWTKESTVWIFGTVLGIKAFSVSNSQVVLWAILKSIINVTEGNISFYGSLPAATSVVFTVKF